MLQSILALLIAIGVTHSTVMAEINFNNQQSQIKVGDGAELKITRDTQVGGKIKVEGSGSLKLEGVGARIQVQEGEVEDKSSNQTMSGQYSLSSDTGSAIVMDGGDVLKAQTGTVINSLTISGNGNFLQGNPIMLAPITLTDDETVLNLSLSGPLSNAIELNGGKLVLLADLAFTHSYFIKGSGEISTDSFSLTTGAMAPLTHTTDLSFTLNTHINLQNDLILDGRTEEDENAYNTWTVDGKMVVNGNGNVFNVRHGKIVIASDSVLQLYDLELKNIGANSIEFTDDTSVLRLSNVRMSLDEDVSYDAGLITVYGDTEIDFRNNTMTLDALNPEQLTIDGAQLTYIAPLYDFGGVNAHWITLKNNGVIRDNNDGISVASITASKNTTLTSNYLINAAGEVSFTYEDLDDVIVDMNNHTIDFARTENKILKVSDLLTTATLKNGTLRNFSTSLISLDTDWSELIIGDKAVLDITQDETIEVPFTIDGAVTIEANGSVIDMNSTAITVNSDATLTIRDATLRNVADGLFALAGDTSSVRFENVVIELASDTTWDTGSITIVRHVQFTGGYTFTFSSDETCTVQPNAQCVIGRDTSFSYEPASGGTSGFVLAARSASLVLDNGTFIAPDTGLVLLKGHIIARGNSSMRSNATLASNALFLGDGTAADNNVLLTIAGGNTLRITNGFVLLRDAAA